MSGNDDRDLPRSDGEDAAVVRAWRRASDEQPPARLDDAILAAARESVRPAGARVDLVRAIPRPRNRWLQWQPLLAAASVAGLAFVLVQLLPRDRDVAPATRSVEQAPVAAPAMEKQPAMDRQHEATSRPATTAPGPAGAAAGPVTRSAAEEAASTAVGAMARTQSPGDADQPGAADRAARAARIAALHASGDEAGAADALRAFRAAEPHADEYLPESLRDWARTIE